jgi:hypothetical protein
MIAGACGAQNEKGPVVAGGAFGILLVVRFLIFLADISTVRKHSKTPWPGFFNGGAFGGGDVAHVQRKLRDLPRDVKPRH